LDNSFLQALAQARPDPGGGAAAAHAAALGIALLEKVAKLEQQRPACSVQPDWHEFLRRIFQVAAALARLQNEDVQAYFNFSKARGSHDPEELPAALEEAMGCPLRIMQQTQEALALISLAGARCKPHLLSDLLVACELQGAAFRGAHHIARANLLFMRRSARRNVWAADLAHTLKAAEAVFRQVSAELLQRVSCH
jgi:formiminotetrahydrofolate cyclodeaminase